MKKLIFTCLLTTTFFLQALGNQKDLADETGLAEINFSNHKIFLPEKDLQSELQRLKEKSSKAHVFTFLDANFIRGAVVAKILLKLINNDIFSEKFCFALIVGQMLVSYYNHEKKIEEIEAVLKQNQKHLNWR